MADASGTPSTNFSIPKLNTSVDAPSGNGENTIVDSIDTLLAKGFVILSAKGDIVYSSAANVAARLPIGATGNVLTVAGGVPTWAAPAAGGLAVIFDVQVARGNAGDPATGATVIDSNTILGGNIPSTYKHLQLIVQARSANASLNDAIGVRFNNDSTANYDYGTLLGASGTATNSEAFAVSYARMGIVTGNTGGAGLSGLIESMIPNYNGTIWNKQVLSKSAYKYGTSAGNEQQEVDGGHWRSTAAITRLQFIVVTGAAFSDGSRITLYGMP